MKKLGHGLSKVDERVKELQKKFETITKENATLKLKLDKSEEIIQSAESLVDKLTGEFQRWTAQVVLLFWWRYCCCCSVGLLQEGLIVWRKVVFVLMNFVCCFVGLLLYYW